MTAPSFTIATWSLQWKRPDTLACRMMVDRLIELDPDIVCLTEAYATTALPDGHLIEAEPDYGYPLIDGRRKVILWNKQA